MRLISLILLLFSSASFSNEWVYIGADIEGKTSIVPANDKLWEYVIDSSEQDFLDKSAYTFQFRDMDEEILINAFCDAQKRSKYRSSWVRVYDGGNCYFQLKYDPKKKIFSELWVNGES